MKFKQIGETSRDCTSPYEVSDYKAITVREFIEEALTERPAEWGDFTINDGTEDWFLKNKSEYKYGSVINHFSGDFLDMEISGITARGGYSNMDYTINIKKTEIPQMKRKVDIEEIRHFFTTANEQFEESGLSLLSVRFRRNEDGKLDDIFINYTENGINIHENEQNPK